MNQQVLTNDLSFDNAAIEKELAWMNVLDIMHHEELSIYTPRILWEFNYLFMYDIFVSDPYFICSKQFCSFSLIDFMTNLSLFMFAAFVQR